MSARLSVCCMTAGRRPGLLAGILRSLRPVADEIVVAVEVGKEADVAEAVAELADLVLSFPGDPPADRAIAWLFNACSGDWIFNVDDDEVPSPRLVAALPAVVGRSDITHAWVARRWLYPTRDTYLAEPPWGTEFQLRLALADERFLQFSEVFHRPVVCHGPALFLDAPLWHLDTALNPAARRSRKALAYERERPGMRVGGLAHNTGFYVPEAASDPVLADVPEGDRAAIASALGRQPEPVDGPARASRRAASSAEIDRFWPGPPAPESLYRATLAAENAPRALRAGVQVTIDVHLTNGSEQVWRWGKEARPELRLGYRWERDGAEVADPLRLRTALPADLAPGETQLVPVHVVPPAEAGAYVLELDVIHERVRWFGCGVSFAVEVRPRERTAVIGPPAALPELVADLRLSPAVELVAILRDAADRELYADYETAEGFRAYLLGGAEGKGRAGTAWQLLRRTLEIARAARRGGDAKAVLTEPLGALSSTDALVLAGPTWGLDAAPSREWLALAATALAWRAHGLPVVLRAGALPPGSRLRERSLRWALRRLASS